VGPHARAIFTCGIGQNPLWHTPGTPLQYCSVCPRIFTCGIGLEPPVAHPWYTPAVLFSVPPGSSPAA